MRTEDRLPSGFPLVRGVFIADEYAADVWKLFEMALKEYRRDGFMLNDLPPAVRDIVSAVAAAARAHRGESPTSTAPPVVWLSTSVAAQRAACSTQAIRDAARMDHLTYRRRGRFIDVSEAALTVWMERRAEGRAA